MTDPDFQKIYAYLGKRQVPKRRRDVSTRDPKTEEPSIWAKKQPKRR